MVSERLERRFDGSIGVPKTIIARVGVKKSKPWLLDCPLYDSREMAPINTGVNHESCRSLAWDFQPLLPIK
jgi:hypothetical protein